MKQNRWGVGLALLNIVLAFALLSRTGSAANETSEDQPLDVIRGTALELTDAAGVVRAQINVQEDGAVVFRMRDEKGQIRIKIGADDESSGILLLDEQIEPRVQILGKTGGGSLKLIGENRTERLLEP